MPSLVLPRMGYTPPFAVTNLRPKRTALVLLVSIGLLMCIHVQLILLCDYTAFTVRNPVIIPPPSAF